MTPTHGERRYTVDRCVCFEVSFRTLQAYADRTGCDVEWINDTSFGNSAQLSTTTGLIYGWGPDPNAVGVDAYYFQVLRRTTDVAHVAGHLLALEHATRGLVLTDRTRSTVCQ